MITIDFQLSDQAATALRDELRAIADTLADRMPRDRKGRSTRAYVAVRTMLAKLDAAMREQEAERKREERRQMRVEYERTVKQMRKFR